MKMLKRRFWQALDLVRAPRTGRGTLEDCIERPLGATGNRPRVLFAGVKYDYGFRRRGLSFEEYNFVHPLASMGFDLLRFDSGISRRAGRGQASRLLWEAVLLFRPLVMLSVLFRDDFDPDIIEAITDRSGTVTVNWFCDDHWRFGDFSSRWAPRFRWIVTTYRPALDWYREIGYRHVILSQWACNHFLYRPLDLPKVYDVTFVGQPHGNRYETIRTLRRAGLSVKTWGAGWPEGRLNQVEMIRVFNQSKINLNLSNASRKAPNQIKARDFEIPGCRGFLITGRAEGIDEYYRVGEEIVCYENVDDLVDKVRYYLLHEEERDAIATRGYSRVCLEHTYVHRFGRIFAEMGLTSIADDMMDSFGLPRQDV